MAISAFLSPNPLPPSSTSRKSSLSAAASASLFLFLKSSQTFRIFASRAGAAADAVDLAGAFWISCAVPAARNKEHATAVRINFIFSPGLNRMRRYHSEHGEVKIPTLSPKNARKVGHSHDNVWTSTDSTAGRSRTIGFQLSPASAEQYTWPPVVPK